MSTMNLPEELNQANGHVLQPPALTAGLKPGVIGWAADLQLAVLSTAARKRTASPAPDSRSRPDRPARQLLVSSLQFAGNSAGHNSPG